MVYTFDGNYIGVYVYNQDLFLALAIIIASCLTFIVTYILYKECLRW